MGKARYNSYRNPRAIVQSRSDHPSTLYVTIPAKIVKQWQLKEGDILEYVFVTEGIESYVKVRKVQNV